MKFKSEFANAITLFVLLRLLFWSFTWNLTEDIDFSYKYPGYQKTSKDVSSDRGDVTLFKNQFSAVIESFSSVKLDKRESGKVGSSSGSLIPPFNEWREQEITKYEKGSSKEKIAHPSRNLSRRKLNYASAKCGAKILASNRESRHRAAVLSEKSDEYMLNPCKVKTWFIIELCDSVEATQVEIANYELYSSSPKEFSVFWSDVYPTLAWHPLGNFEAKDQRTMQTFDLTEKNLGKFIKVIIYNHHGKEHYCPLSSLRIIGYSMVQKLEAVEQESRQSDPVPDNGFEVQNGTNFVSQKEIKSKTNVSEEYNSTFEASVNTSSIHSSASFTRICSLYFIHCGNSPKAITDDETCPNEPTCFLLTEILRESRGSCNETVCSKSPTKSSTGKNAFYNNTSPERVLPTLKIDSALASKRDQRNDSKYPVAEPSSKTHEESNVRYAKNASSALHSEEGNSKVANVAERTQNATVNDKLEGLKGAGGRQPPDYVASEECVCKNGQRSLEVELLERTSDGEMAPQELAESDHGIDSAGLIQKESVLFKLTVRIKTLETDLNMINKYLQELSQSYRQQMENMKSSFDRTVKAINIATEESTAIDKKQEENINMLQDRMKILNQKTDYLLNGQKDLVKRVLEWHGFFLILEIIIISTIFSVFLNIFYRKKFFEDRNDKFNIRTNKC